MATKSNMLPPNVNNNMQEVLFAQRLADNDKRIRDKALKKLSKFLHAKSSRGPSFSDEEGLKLWKGLFYCMYMADKPLTQEDLADRISCVLHDIQNNEDRHCFIDAAFSTFAREWGGLDVFRVNKFSMFVRRLLRQVFVHVKDCSWNLKEICTIMSILERKVICPTDNIHTVPLELKFLLCDIFLEELGKIGGDEVSQEALLTFIHPYFKVLCLTHIDLYFNEVKERIFQHLMQQSDMGIAYEKGVLDQDGITDSATLEDDGDAEMNENGEEGSDDDDEEVEEEEEQILDPRAGNVDVYIPQLNVNFDSLANALQVLGSLPSIRMANRKKIYVIVNNLRDIASGIYPDKQRGIEESDEYDSEVEEENALTNMQKFEEALKKGKPVKIDKFKSTSKKKKKNPKLLKLKHKAKLKKRDPKELGLNARSRVLERERHTKVEEAIEKLLGPLEQSETQDKTLVGKVCQDNHGFQISDITASVKGGKRSEASLQVDVCRKRKKAEKRKAEFILPEKSQRKKGFSFEVSDIPPTTEALQNGPLTTHTEAKVTPEMSKKSSSEKTLADSKLESTQMGNHSEASVEVSSQAHSKSDVQQTESSPNIVKTDSEPASTQTELQSVASQKGSNRDDVIAVGTPESLCSNDLPADAPVEVSPKISQGTLTPKISQVTLTPKISQGTRTPEISQGTLIPKISQGTLTSKISQETPKLKTPKTKSKLTNTQTEFKLEAPQVKSKLKKTPKKEAKQQTPQAGSERRTSTTELKPKSLTTEISQESAKTEAQPKTPQSKTSLLKKNITTPTDEVDRIPKLVNGTPATNGLVLNFSKDNKQKGFLNGGIAHSSPWEEPLQDGEYEIFIKSKRQMSKEKKMMKKSAFGSTKKLSTPTPVKSRTIKINLKENQTHEFSDYARTLKASPSIPFNATKSPGAPVLKPSPSPILIRSSPAHKYLKKIQMSASPLLKNASPSKKKKKSFSPLNKSPLSLSKSPKHKKSSPKHKKSSPLLKLSPLSPASLKKKSPSKSPRLKKGSPFFKKKRMRASDFF